jgi:hypothetical protein
MFNPPQIEYLIRPDGTIVERVIGGDGINCLTNTAIIEAELGAVIQRELLPEYHADNSQSDLHSDIYPD